MARVQQWPRPELAMWPVTSGWKVSYPVIGDLHTIPSVCPQALNSAWLGRHCVCLDPLWVQREEKRAPCKQRSPVCISFLLPRVRGLMARPWGAVPSPSKSSYAAGAPSAALSPCCPSIHFVQAKFCLWPWCAPVLELLQELVGSVTLRVLLPQPASACRGTALPVPAWDLPNPRAASVSALFHPLSETLFCGGTTVGHQLSSASPRESCPLTSKVATGLGAGFAQVKFSVAVPSASVTVFQKSSQQNLWWYFIMFTNHQELGLVRALPVLFFTSFFFFKKGKL